ncbi:uncharacterized protein PRCAT00001347001 [Priceomyces carsonii]|uniref:uncharacterized protein n=1 Tax=Priceomyces carsonii TaxID=28549 RepID=UPI002ED96496|nr:unnamed protein product [Priceomyces carsonii]
MPEETSVLNLYPPEDVHETPLTIKNFLVPYLYDLKLSIDHLKPNFKGEVVIHLIENERYRGQKPKKFDFYLHALNIVVTKASVISGENESSLKVSYLKQKNQIQLTTTDEYNVSNNSIKICLCYMGQLKTIKTYSDPTYGLFKTNYLDNISGRSDNYVLATHTQPAFSKMLFPLIDELYLKVPIKLSIETLTKFKVVSVSPLCVEPEQIPLTERSYFKFETTPPIAPSVFGFAIGDFEYLENSDLLVPVRVYTAIGESSKARVALNSTVKYLPLLEGLLDRKYPLKKLDFISLPFLSDGAMENWGLITVLSGHLLVDEFKSEDGVKRDVKQLVAHELVHQWIGNLVTFDSWSSLWFNESFATFLGNLVVSISENTFGCGYEIDWIGEYEKLMDRDVFDANDEPKILPIADYMKRIEGGEKTTTSVIFDNDAYQKGLILLRMIGYVMQNEKLDSQTLQIDNFSVMLTGFLNIIKKFEYKTIKLFEVWNHLDTLTSFDLNAFIYSWLSYAGYPLLFLSQVNGSLVIKQKRYCIGSNSNITAATNVYHVPLLLRVHDRKENKVVNKILDQEELSLELPLKDFVTANCNKGGYYRVILSSDIIKQVVKEIPLNLLSTADLISILNDLGKLLETDVSSSEMLVSFICIVNSLSNEQWITDYKVLCVALSYLDKITVILRHFSDFVTYKKWLDGFVKRIFNKVSKWNTLGELSSDYNRDEMNARNAILQLGIGNEEILVLTRKLFKNFISSGISKTFTPMELLPSIFNSFLHTSNQKDYKKVLELVRNSNTSVLGHTNAKSDEIQTVALSSLTFTTKDDLLSKTLNFISSNIDSRCIELGLIGYQYNSSKDQILSLFKWYLLHYDQWVLKSLRQGSEYSKQLSVTVRNISEIILGELMQHDATLLELKNDFVAEKLKKLPEHGLKLLIDNLQKKNVHNITLGKFYETLTKNLPTE